mgnify:CR=1 FL=1
MIRSKKSISIIALVIVLAMTLLAGCQTQPTVTQTGNSNDYKGTAAKYVFLFIGDGMGMAQINTAEIYLGATAKKGANPDITKLSFTQFTAQGMNTTHAADSFIPDSASAGTAIASGFKTTDGVINMDPAKKEKYKSMAEMAKEKGMKVGIVSSVSIDHATPAVFYAHQPTRNNYYDIAMELAKSNFDYFGGGGLVQPKGKDNDKPDALEEAKKNGFKVVNTKDEIMKLDSKSGKVIAINPVLDGSKALTYDMNRKDDLSLADYTRKGIELLENDKGFFMMVEGGKIDWACHANDGAASIKDTIAFSDAVAEAVKFYEKHPKETLIVVTGDHETGGMTIGFAGTKYETFFEVLGGQKVSFDEFDKKFAEFKKGKTEDSVKIEDVLPLIQDSFGLSAISTDNRKDLEKKAKEGDKEAAKKLKATFSEAELNSLKDALKLSMKEKKDRPTDDQTYLLYGGYEPLSVTLTHILNQKAGIGWTTYSHTGVAIPVYAKGVGQELFVGYYDDTDTGKKIRSIMGVSNK